MSGKDLLAVLAMIVPSFLLIALIAITLLPPARFEAAPPGTGMERDSARKEAHAQLGATKTQGIATQDMIRDFWGRPYCTSCVHVTEPARCNSSAHDDERACF